MSFAGNLRTVSFGDVLQLISTGRKTGALILTRPQRGKKIFFRSGDIIAAISDPPTDEERLGQLLMRRGLLTEADLDKALRRQRSTGRKLGQILADQGVVSRDAVTAALRSQVEEAVYGVFGWPDGEFRFHDDEAPDPSQILVDLNAVNAMMEGARRFDEYSEIAHTLPKEETVLRISPTPKLAQPEMVLTPEDIDVLAAVDGARSVAEIVGAGSYGEYAASRSLHKLLSATLLEPCPVVATRQRRRAEADEVYPLILKVYGHALESVHKMLVEQLGSAGERTFYRLPETCGRDQWEILPVLLDSGGAGALETFRERVARIPAPVRLHRVLGLASRLLGEAVNSLSDRLGPRLAARTVSALQKELAFLWAQKRALAEEYDILTDFQGALRGSARVVYHEREQTS